MKIRGMRQRRRRGTNEGEKGRDRSIIGEDKGNETEAEERDKERERERQRQE